MKILLQTALITFCAFLSVECVRAEVVNVYTRYISESQVAKEICEPACAHYKKGEGKWKWDGQWWANPYAFNYSSNASVCLCRKYGF